MYATPQNLLDRFDVRLLGDLCQDGNSRLSEAALLTNTKLSEALKDASGMVESAALVGKRYEVTDLSGLTGNSKSLLVRIVCDLAIVWLCQRRGYSVKDKFPMADESLKILDRIRLGERVFNVEAVVEAASASTVEGHINLTNEYFISRTNKMFVN